MCTDCNDTGRLPPPDRYTCHCPEGSRLRGYVPPFGSQRHGHPDDDLIGPALDHLDDHGELPRFAKRRR